MRVEKQSGKAALQLSIQKTKIMASDSITSWQIDGEKMETVTYFIFLGSKINVDSEWSDKIKRCLLLGKKSYGKPRGHNKKQRHHFADKGPYSQSYGFFSSHVQMWEFDHNKGWVLKNWCFWIVVLKKTLESHLGSQEIKPVNPKGNQPWILTGGTDAKAEAPILGHHKKLTHWKKPWCWGNWEQGEKGTTDDEVVGWHHQLNGHESEQVLGNGDLQRGLSCCSSWGCKELDMI